MLEDEHPDVAAYLRSLSSGDAQPPVGNGVEVSELAVDQYANQQTSSLLHETQRIMEESERDGVDPDERLREVVERAVRDGFSYGGRIGEGDAVVDVDGEEAKRTRVNGNEPT